MGMLNKITAALRGLGVQNRYDAAGTGRRMRGWTAPSTGPNKAIAGLQNIRNRARDAARNDWSGESATQKWVSNLVGIGITPRLKHIPAGPRKRELAAMWDRWVQQSDADGAPWVEVPYLSSSPQTVGTFELTHELDNVSAERLRVRLTLSGSHTARPALRNLRAVVL